MSHHHTSIAISRAGKLLQRVKKLILIGEPLPFAARFARSENPVPFAQRLSLSYQPITEGENWGKTWDSAWFHITATVPKEWAGAYVVARIDLVGEGLLFDTDGNPLQGLSPGSVFDAFKNKDLVHLLPQAKGGEKLEYWLEGAANELFGVRQVDPEHNPEKLPMHGHYQGTVKALRLQRFDHEMWRLWLELEVLDNLRSALATTSTRWARLVRGLDQAVSAFNREGAAAARAVLKPLLDVPTDPHQVRWTAVGHAHIDTGWLWPVRETIRKCARTYANQLDLIQRYPGYVFGASAAQHHAMVKEHYPSLYRRIQQAVKAGTWELQGAMWVEADCNLPSGESLVRQVLHGKRFFKSEFGVEVKNLWLPDVFGYSGQLPQILRKAGVPCFLTQKLSWNKTNQFPHHTFAWQGIDGSEVVAHFPPNNDYNSKMRPEALVKGIENYKDKAVCDDAICLFGIGDGGGGPREEFVERGLLLKNLNGCPPVAFGHAQPALERLAAKRADLDAWKGELYFELHRGTYTTQTRTKRLNRRAEEALRAAEMLCAAAGLAHYPASELDRAWKTVLLNQFHDIIPGSSIQKVYQDAEAQLAGVIATARDAAATAAARLGTADAQACSLFNASSEAFDGLVRLPAGWKGASGSDGKLVPCQAEGDVVLARVRVPGQGFLTLRQAANAVATTPKPVTGDAVLENGRLRFTIGRDGRISEGLDKASGRAVLRGPGNDLALYEDRPHAWDAWDIDEQVLEERIGGLVVTGLTRRDGPLRSTVTVRGTVGRSPIELVISLDAEGSRLDVAGSIDWQERHKLLKTLFPLAVDADTATCEIQYGTVRRPTVRNTSWDTARFEVCAHRYVDVSERDWGVALVNDGKFGHGLQQGQVSLSLLRAPTAPDPEADLGRQEFAYALCPHDGGADAPVVRQHAAALNQGLTVLPGLDAGTAALPVRLEGEGLELATLKAAEDGGALIARVVETRGGRARGRLTCRDARWRIVPTDLMEWEDRREAAGTGSLDLDLGAFSIETYRLVPA